MCSNVQDSAVADGKKKSQKDLSTFPQSLSVLGKTHTREVTCTGLLWDEH